MNRKLEEEKKSRNHRRNSRFELFHPGNLQREIDSYGYSFSMGKYSVFIFVTVAGAIGCSALFSLRWYLMVLIVMACTAVLPFLILDGYKQMYEHRQFLDVSDYMEQVLYSFRLNQKILLSLKDTRSLFEEGRMYQVLGEAINYIEQGSFEKDLYREALGIVEKAYHANRLLAVHEYMCTVESNGGACKEGIDLLLQDKAVWAENVMLLQEDKKAARMRVIFSLFVTVFLAVVFHCVYRSMPARYSIIYHPITQSATTLYLILNIWIVRKANKQIAKSWIEAEDMEEEKMYEYFQIVTSFQEKIEMKKSLILGIPLFVFGAAAGLRGHFLAASVLTAGSVLLLNQHKIGYRIAYDRVVREINRVFPGWLMEMALLLQGNNVQVSIEKTIETAPAVLKTDLQRLSDSLKQTPNALEPYLGFLGMFRLSSVLSSMKMLYAISESGSGIVR